MIIRTICDGDTPFARALNSKKAEVMWHVDESKPLKDHSQLASFLQPLGMDPKNAPRLGIGKTFFVTSKDGTVVYDPAMSPTELGLKNGCSARITLNRAQIKPKQTETTTQQKDGKPSLKAVTATARSTSAEKPEEGIANSEPKTLSPKPHRASSMVSFAAHQDDFAPSNLSKTEKVGHATTSSNLAVLNVDEYLAHIDNAQLHDNLAEMMDKLNNRLAQQLQSDFAREEEALRTQHIQGKLDELLVHICRRQVLKMQQIQQLVYEKEVLRTLQERRSSTADVQPLAHNHQFQTTCLGESLSRSYFPSIFQLL